MSLAPLYLFDPSKLRALRLDRGLSQSQLGRLVGSEQPEVSRWEAGLKAPCNATLRKLAKELRVEVDQLMQGSPLSTKIVRARQEADADDGRQYPHARGVPWSVYIAAVRRHAQESHAADQ